jgi:Carboxypeptidase regulatory-like domain/TonB dependent receptor
MKKVSSFGLVLALIGVCMALDAPVALASKGALATIAGSVKDSKGNPLAGAVISLIKEGAKAVVKETRSGADGSFSTKVPPGRYGIRAIAQGFNEVVFSAVEVRASQELIYKFNLEPVGSGRTLPERRRDRDDVRWTLRSARSSKSIFQIQEGDDANVNSVIAAEDSGNDRQTQATMEVVSESNATESVKGPRTQGVVETYFAANSAVEAPFVGMNFAVSTPASEHLDLIFVGQTGVGPSAPKRFEVTGLVRAGQRHRIAVSMGGIQLANFLLDKKEERAEGRGQLSVRAIDEWVVRDGVVIVFGLDYSRFLGAGGAHSLSPRLGVQFDANAHTRVKAAYAPGGNENRIRSIEGFEGHPVVFNAPNAQPVAFVDGRAVMERSRRFEIGIERVLDNESNVEATAFFDTTSGRGVGLMSTPLSAFSGAPGEALLTIANQQGAARGMRVVYTRRLSHAWTASAAYSFGRGQRLRAGDVSAPADLFTNGFFQTAAVQLGAGFGNGTHVRTIFRFSRDATVFAIDPLAGRLGVYDPSLSIQVTQELPTFGLPLHAEAIIDARNLLDAQPGAENRETLIQVSTTRRSVRGGISLRF